VSSSLVSRQRVMPAFRAIIHVNLHAGRVYLGGCNDGAFAHRHYHARHANRIEARSLGGDRDRHQLQFVGLSGVGHLGEPGIGARETIGEGCLRTPAQLRLGA
jgi:hypothetical protein